MGTFEFDGEKYKKASRHQKEWGNTHFLLCHRWLLIPRLNLEELCEELSCESQGISYKIL
ncbi:MAG: hypothetical protein J1F64_07425 [Oscillospiraceae bacterium]|nr:hypothetical protein [Oscillospiraceae bacterium]